MQRCGDTPSVIACGDATFPKGTAFGGGDKVSGVAQRRPLGGAVERSETEGVRIPKVAVAILNRIYTGEFPYTQSSRCTARHSGCFVIAYRRGG